MSTNDLDAPCIRDDIVGFIVIEGNMQVTVFPSSLISMLISHLRFFNTMVDIGMVARFGLLRVVRSGAEDLIWSCNS